MHLFLPKLSMKKHRPILVIILLLCIWIGLMNRWDNPYGRPIVGDAKGYYAYLPAIFIHQDLKFSFVEQVERDYYPEDFSLWKDFLVEQPNGSFVNKCFPGVAVFYLPFFLISYFLSYVLGFPLDGYSVLFQWSIIVAHVCYYALALILLNAILKRNEIRLRYRFMTMFLLTFGTNVFFYSVFDFSVVHIFGFFGTTLFIYWLHRLSDEFSWIRMGKLFALLALLIIMRPTNALVVLSIPLFTDVPKIWLLIKGNFSLRTIPYIYVLLIILIFSIPLTLWKVQTGNWLVYSYGDEKMDFLNPNLVPFLFSVLKGWWFWTPIMLLMFVGAAYYYGRQHVLCGFYFAGSIIAMAYIFSSWWIWTYGGGMGQRPMIDFYPIIAIGFAGFLQSFRREYLLAFVFVPLLCLNMIQAFQIHKYILVGGETTWENYKSQFLQLKRPAPQVEIDPHWKLVAFFENRQEEFLNSDKHYSNAIEIDSIDHQSTLIVRVKIAGKHESSSLALVVSDSVGQYYQALYMGNFIYRQPRVLVYRFVLPQQHLVTPLKLYVWNSDSDEHAHIYYLEAAVYTPPN